MSSRTCCAPGRPTRASGSAGPAEERRTREVQKVYSQLFDIHQKLSNFAETYELRLGLGCAGRGAHPAATRSGATC